MGAGVVSRAWQQLQRAVRMAADFTVRGLRRRGACGHRHTYHGARRRRRLSPHSQGALSLVFVFAGLGLYGLGRVPRARAGILLPAKKSQAPRALGTAANIQSLRNVGLLSTPPVNASQLLAPALPPHAAHRFCVEIQQAPKDAKIDQLTD